MPQTPLHPEGVVVLANPAGIIQLESNALGETSIAQTLMSDRNGTESWMIRTHAQYLAPEVLGRLNAPVDARSDIFSIGTSLYETLTGHTPAPGSDFLSKVHQILAVDAQPVYDLIPGIPKELSQIISKCLAKAPRDRYTSAHSLRYDLEHLAHAWKTRSDMWDAPLIDVGAMDHFSRFRILDKLVGVEESIASIRSALDHAHQGERSLVSIRGSSGTGKTALASSIREEVESTGGAFCQGKYDSTSYNPPLAPIWQIINQLALPLLSLPESELDVWRLRIRDTVGSTLVPFFEIFIDSDLRTALRLRNASPSPENITDTSLPPSYKDAFYGAIRRFLIMFIGDISADEPSPGTRRPLVLFVDDVQWSSADDIVFYRQITSGNVLSGCLLLFAFRDTEGTEAFIHSELRKELCGY